MNVSYWWEIFKNIWVDQVNAKRKELFIGRNFKEKNSFKVLVLWLEAAKKLLTTVGCQIRRHLTLVQYNTSDKILVIKPLPHFITSCVIIILYASIYPSYSEITSFKILMSLFAFIQKSININN